MGRKWGCLASSPGPFLCPRLLDLTGRGVFPKAGRAPGWPGELLGGWVSSWVAERAPGWLGELPDRTLLISQQPWEGDIRHSFYLHSMDGKTEARMVLLVVLWLKRTQTSWLSALSCLQGTHDMGWPRFLRGLCRLTCPRVGVRSQGGWHSIGEQSNTEQSKPESLRCRLSQG